MADALTGDALAVRNFGKRKVVTVVGGKDAARPFGQYFAVKIEEEFPGQVLFKHGEHPCKVNCFTSISPFMQLVKKKSKKIVKTP